MILNRFVFQASSKSMHARFPSVEQRRPQVPPPPEIELDFVQQLQNPRKVHQRHSSSHGSRPPSIQESIGGPRTPKSPSSPSFLGFGWFIDLIFLNLKVANLLKSIVPQY